MNIRALCEGSFTLPIPVSSAVPLFTPEGERKWAGSSWDPIYAIPDAANDDSSPGTVFTTEGDRGTSVWIVLERRDDRVSYARIAPDRIAGTITVQCAEAASPRETKVVVRYDTTSLGPDGAQFVSDLEAGYDTFLGEWRREIMSHLGSERETRQQE